MPIKGRGPVLPGGRERDFGRLALDHLGAQMSGAGPLTEDDRRRMYELVDNPSTWYLPMLMVTAWGRRPDRPVS